MTDEGHYNLPQSRVEVGQGENERAKGCEDGRREPLQAPRRPDPEQHTHQHSEVPSGQGDEVALLHILSPAQPCASRATRVAHVREASLRALRSQPLKTPTSATAYPPAIGVECLSPSCGLVRPAAR